MWTALLIAGCEVDTLWVTGGGEVTVSLVGEGIDESFVVQGLSEDELKEVFAGGHQPTDVLWDLNFKRVDPDFAAGWHVQVGEEFSWVELVHNDIGGFTPCDRSLRHAEWSTFLEDDISVPGRLQFDERGPDEVSEELAGDPPPTLIERAGASSLFFHPELRGLVGTYDLPVTVRCKSVSASATLSVVWELDEDVQRRAFRRAWKSTPGPTGPAQL